MSEAIKFPLWQKRLITSKEGKPKPLLANALIVLREHPQWKGVIGFNIFANRVELRKAAPWENFIRQNSSWTDVDDTFVAEHLQHLGIFVSREIAGLAVNSVARDNLFHPVREYLAGLTWDGAPRLDAWLQDYLGAVVDNSDDATRYLSAVGAKWMLSAVARVEEPGAKVDHMPILEGGQGMRKSTALKVLFQPWFADEIADLGSKDSAMQLSGVWCVEMGELDSLHRAEKERIKAFITRTSDRFRPPYGHRVVEVPRQCVFAGTVNGSEYLKDETGNRRFWPVTCTKIDVGALGRDRDQLWGEAFARYQTGETWWLEDHAHIRAAQVEQQARYASDPWRGRIEKFIHDRSNVTTYEILREALDIPDAKMTRSDQTRVGSELRALGWLPRQVWRDGVRVRIYVRQSDDT